MANQAFRDMFVDNDPYGIDEAENEKMRRIMEGQQRRWLFEPGYGKRQPCKNCKGGRDPVFVREYGGWLCTKCRGIWAAMPAIHRQRFAVRRGSLV